MDACTTSRVGLCGGHGERRWNGYHEYVRSFDRKNWEMEYVYMVGWGNSDKFGKSKGPMCYESVPARELKNEAQHAFGPCCLNRGRLDHTLARECPEGYMNKLGVIHHSMGVVRGRRVARNERGGSTASALTLLKIILRRN